MFVITVTYKAPGDVIDKFLDAHKRHLEQYYAEGIILTSGPQNPRIGGVILVKGQDKAVVDELIQRDPFYLYGYADYAVVEFIPRTCQPGLESFCGLAS